MSCLNRATLNHTRNSLVKPSTTFSKANIGLCHISCTVIIENCFVNYAKASLSSNSFRNNRLAYLKKVKNVFLALSKCRTSKNLVKLDFLFHCN